MDKTELKAALWAARAEVVRLGELLRKEEPDVFLVYPSWGMRDEEVYLLPLWEGVPEEGGHGTEALYASVCKGGGEVSVGLVRSQDEQSWWDIPVDGGDGDWEAFSSRAAAVERRRQRMAAAAEKRTAKEAEWAAARTARGD